MDKQITIRMPKELLAKWLAALRSERYRQGKDALHCLHENSFCCLGVLQTEAAGEVEEQEDGTQLPPLYWLTEHGIGFYNCKGSEADDPFLPSLGVTAATANDESATFRMIADAIEACSEGY